MIKRLLLLALFCAATSWSRACTTFVLTALQSGAETLPPATVKLAGPWSVTVAVTVDGGPVSATLDIEPPRRTTVEAEAYGTLAPFDPKAPGWKRGTPLAGLRAFECTVKGALAADSLVVRDGPGAWAMTFERGWDFAADLDWGTVGRLPGGRIKPDQKVFISYAYVKRRIDSAVLAADRKTIRLLRGEPHVATCAIPDIAPGETRLANIYLQGVIPALVAGSLFPILEAAYPEARTSPPAAETLIPKAFARLKSGGHLSILAWGDSVTAARRWQEMFVQRLRAAYPAAKIDLVTEAWGGRNTASYLAEPPGSEHNYKEKVLAAKPDLIISEFVNDASLSRPQVRERYGRLLADFQSIGAEWIILTPHYVMQEWMHGFTSQREIDEDPREYVTALREFAGDHHLALADVSRRYGRLWRQGIPYVTLLENTINHPNNFGHSLFADSLMALFP